MGIKALLPTLILIMLVSGCVQSEITGNVINKEEIKQNLSMLVDSGEEKKIVETLSEPVTIDEGPPCGGNCDDMNQCTIDYCNELTNSCEHIEKVCPNTSVICPDGTKLTVSNTCIFSTGECSSNIPTCPQINTTNSSIVPSAQCNESWSCSNWSACSNGMQTRTCIDQNSCGTTINKPAESQQCTQTQQPDIINIQYDPAGNDRDNLTEEWVFIVGSGVDMSNWTLSDAANHTFIFPTGFVISGSVKVRTGNGTNTQTDLYWNSGKAIWNNKGGDTATLKDSSGNVIDVYSYS